MNIKKFSRINKLRNKHRDAFNHKIRSWSVAEWTNALAGEAGEAANIGKKILRLNTKNIKLLNKKTDLYEKDLVDRLMDELADVVIYADLIAHRVNRDLWEHVVYKFNLLSTKMGLDDKFFYVENNDKSK